MPHNTNVQPIENPHAQEAQSRWPDAYARSQRNWSTLTAEQQQAHLDLGTATTQQLANLFTGGATASDSAVQAQIAEHYRWVDLWWTPNREAYIGLGQMYVDDPRFAANYESLAPGLAAFMRDAMRQYAEANLT